MCPFCSKTLESEEIKGLTSNFILKGILGETHEPLEEDKEDRSDDSGEAELCQRCEAEDAEVCCVTCGNFKLCKSCEDLIHSMGCYDQHKRMPITEKAEISQEQVDWSKCQVH